MLRILSGRDSAVKVLCSLFVLAAIAPCGLDQSPVSPLNPFLDSGPAAPTFTFAQPGKMELLVIY